MNKFVKYILPIIGLSFSGSSCKCEKKLHSSIEALSSISVVSKREKPESFISADGVITFKSFYCNMIYQSISVRTSDDNYYLDLIDSRDSSRPLSVLVEANMGRNICFRNTMIAHVNIGPSVMAVISHSEQSCKLNNMEAYLGINAAHIFETPDGILSVVPEISLYLLSWDVNTRYNLEFNSIKLERKSFCPMIVISVPLRIKMTKRLGLISSVSVISANKPSSNSARLMLSLGCSYDLA